MHHAPAVHAGQSWTQGPVVLNALDIRDSYDLSGYNGDHEVAHKLDARGSGYTSGIPAIALRDVASWEKDLLQAMAEIEAEVDLVGEQAATSILMPPAIRRNVLPCCRSTFSAPRPARQPFSGHVSPPAAVLPSGSAGASGAAGTGICLNHDRFAALLAS